MSGHGGMRRGLLAGLTAMGLVAVLLSGAGAASATETPAPIGTPSASPVSTPTATPAPVPEPAAPAPTAAPAPAPESTPVPEQTASPEPSAEPEPTTAPTPTPEQLEPYRIPGVSTASFDPDDLISDRNLYTGGRLDAAAVQSFLEQQVPQCRDGYTCLRDFRTTTSDIPASAECRAYDGKAKQRASAVIAAVGAACGVSERAILALLQKESELVDDDFPGQRQYDQAMGFDCSDSAPCNPEYKGFFEQVYWRPGSSTTTGSCPRR